jgi:hypothetical protein
MESGEKSGVQGECVSTTTNSGGMRGRRRPRKSIARIVFEQTGERCPAVLVPAYSRHVLASISFAPVLLRGGAASVGVFARTTIRCAHRLRDSVSVSAA